MDVASLKGPWGLPEVEAFLQDTTVPIRLATVGDDHFPRVVSLWFRYDAGALYCVTHQDSHLARMLERNANVGFEISGDTPPYYGIRGQGTVSLTPLGKSPLLRDLLTRYMGAVDSSLAQWLLSRSEQEKIITLLPLRLYSWDYRERMGSA